MEGVHSQNDTVRSRIRHNIESRPIRRSLRAWRKLRPLMGGSWAKPLGLAAASLTTGLAEAALLALIAQVALALSRGIRVLDFELGPIALTAPAGWLIGGAGLLALIRLALQGVVTWLPARIASDVQYWLQTELFDTYVHADWPTKAVEADGRLQELLTTHVLKATSAVLIVTSGFTSVFALLALLASALVIHSTTALLLSGGAVGMFLALRPAGRLVLGLNREVSDQNLKLATTVSEAVRLGEETSVFGTALPQVGRFRTLATHLRELFYKAGLANRFVPAAYQSVALILLVGGLAAIALLDTSGIAALGAVVLILVRALSYGQQTQAFYTDMNAHMPFVDQVLQDLNKYRKSQQSPGTQPLERINHLLLDNVSFSYGDSIPALESVSLTISSGDVIGISGPSGAGKTTLVHILLRMRTPTQGRYLVNGISTESICHEDWQRLVAYVPQDPKLLRGTVADNIRFFRDFDDRAVERAARLAHIHQEILLRQGGYQARIDQRQDTLSGGQRQRICLARALIGQPQMLVLDEPTSALDTASEDLVLDSLKALRGRMSIILVAHRPALLDICDQVIQVPSVPSQLRAPQHTSPYDSFQT